MEVKKTEIYGIARSKIDKLTEESFFYKLTVNKENELYQTVNELIQGKITVDSLKNLHAVNFEQNNLLLTQKTDSTFKALNYKVAFQIDIEQITLNETQENLLAQPFTLLTTNRKITTPKRIDTHTWEINESRNSSNNSDEECVDCPEDYKRHYTIIGRSLRHD